MSDHTRLDDASTPALTRLDSRVDPGQLSGATRLDGAVPRGASAVASSVFNLPAALATRWRIVAPIPAGGAEAELFVVARQEDGFEAVAKIYRPGLKPRSAALERIETTLREHMIPVFERGESDGLAYEVMEYCRHGSLRALLPACVGDAVRIEALLAELTPALETLHRAGLIHRDLKPENVLVRTTAPLDLVLADFGIASVTEGTHHFTSTSRTVRYAAPEAMTGVISSKADCWSLGMILFEALTGRHPFDGLSEAVVNHQLVTHAVDVSAVADPAWRALLRGLLLRDPARRWGTEEVRRWLDRDPGFDRTHAPAEEPSAAPMAHPYRIEGLECFTAEELGVALVRHWGQGVRDLARGFVANWLSNDLRDLNLARFIHDLADDTNLTPDMRLLRFAYRVAPSLPAAWKGISLGDDSLAAACRRALDGGAAEARWIAEVVSLNVAAQLPERHPDRAALMTRIGRWQSRARAFKTAAHRLLEAQQSALRLTAEAGTVADFDELMYGSHQMPVSDLPLPHAALLAIDIAPSAVERLRPLVASLALEISADCEWFLTLGNIGDLAPEALVALHAASARARAFAQRHAERRARAAAADREACAHLLREFESVVHDLWMNTFDRRLGESTRLRIRQMVDHFAELHTRVHEPAHAKPPFDALRLRVRKARPFMHAVAKALDRLDYLERLRGAVVSNAAPIGFSTAVVLALVRLPVLVYGVLAAIGLAVGWYFWERQRAVDGLVHAVDRLPASRKTRAAA